MYKDVEEFYWKCRIWCYLVLGVSWGPVAVAGGTAGVSNLEAGLFELNLLNISHLTTNCWELPTLSAAFCLLHQRVSIKFVLRHSDSSLYHCPLLTLDMLSYAHHPEAVRILMLDTMLSTCNLNDLGNGLL